MKFANIRELQINANTVLKNRRKEDFVMTNRGRPVAAVIYMDEDLLDSFVIAHHPTLLREIERDLDLWKKGKLKTYSLEQVRARLLAGKRPKKKGRK